LSKGLYCCDSCNNYLEDACYYGNENVFFFLIRHGADINKEDNCGRTPLFWACRNGNEKIFNYLLEHGADINKESEFFITPLFNMVSIKFFINI